jgi:Fic family protein
MMPALDAFEKYLHLSSNHPPLIRLAFIHYQFEAIHPFLDGNGRIGRLLISLLLVEWNLLPLPLLYLSAFFEQRRQDYYTLLLAVSERGAWREWLTFFLQGVSQQAQDAINRAKRLQDLQIKWRQVVTQTRASAAIVRLTDSLFNTPIVTIPAVQKTLGVTYHSAQLDVEKLIKLGILQQTNESQRGKTFVASAILDITSGR